VADGPETTLNHVGPLGSDEDDPEEKTLNDPYVGQPPQGTEKPYS